MSRARELAKVGGVQQRITGFSSHVGMSTFLGMVHMEGHLQVDGNASVDGNLTVTGTTTFNGGTLNLGNAATDNVVFGGEVDSNIIPDDDGSFDLGSSSKEWKDLFIDGTAHIDTLDVDENAGIIGNLTLTGNADFNGDLDVDGTTNLDVVDIDGAVDMASNLVIAGNIDANGNLDVDGTTDLDTTNVVGTLTVTGDIAADNVTVNGNTVSTSSGNLTLDSSGGTVSVADNLTVSGTATFNTALANSNLANSTVSFGGISLALGGSDATPAFDLTDATNYPTSSLSGTITNAQLAGSIANDKMANATVSYGGVSLSLGGSDATPAFDLQDATGYPTSSLTGTITNTQLAGSIANGKLSNSTVSYGGVSLSLGGTDATPAFNLADATGLPISSGVSGLASNVASFLGTPSSANLRSVLTDETGSGVAVFGTSPTIATPTLTGTTVAANLDISGQVDIDGHTDLDNVSVAGVSTFASGVTITGALDANGGASIDNVQIGVTNNNEIDTSSGNLVIDSAGGTTTVDDNLTVSGNLTVNGTTTTINSTTVAIDDKNFQVATGAADDAAANGAGFTVDSGDGDKTFNFEATGDNWGASENLNLASGKVYKINNSSILSATTLGSSVVSSSLTSVGTLGSLAVTNNITVGGTVDGRDVASDGSKLDGIEASATADQTAAEIRTLVESASDSNVFTDADHSKLNGIEASATADQTAAEIRTLVESASDSNVFTDADHSKLNGIESGATADQTDEEIQDIVGAMLSGNTESGITVTYQDADGTIDFSVASQTDQNFTNADHSKLDGIESGATADQTASEIRALVESASDSNVFTDADHSKLNGIEASATADQTASEILTLIKTVDGAGSGLDADTVDGISSASFLRSDTGDTFSGDLTSSGSARILLQKTDNNVSDHIIFYNGTTRVGEIGVEDTTWLRINQETSKNIYTPRYIRADAGFFVDGTSKGINGSGNFIGGTIAGASDYSTLLRSNTSDTMSGTLTMAGNILPDANGTRNLGANGTRWANIYSSDIDLSNQGKGGNSVDGTWGSYLIEEGEDHLFLTNRRSGKKFRFVLMEV